MACMRGRDGAYFYERGLAGGGAVSDAQKGEGWLVEFAMEEGAMKWNWGL